MTFTVTFEGFVLLLLGIFIVIVGCYFVVVLKNCNLLIQNANKALTENRKSIDNLLQHSEELVGNTAMFSGKIKNQFEKNEQAISRIFQTGADSMLLVNDATCKLRTLVNNFNDIMKLLSGLIKKLK